MESACIRVYLLSIGIISDNDIFFPEKNILRCLKMGKITIQEKNSFCREEKLSNWTTKKTKVMVVSLVTWREPPLDWTMVLLGMTHKQYLSHRKIHLWKESSTFEWICTAMKIPLLQLESNPRMDVVCDMNRWEISFNSSSIKFLFESTLKCQNNERQFFPQKLTGEY